MPKDLTRGIDAVFAPVVSCKERIAAAKAAGPAVLVPLSDRAYHYGLLEQTEYEARDGTLYQVEWRREGDMEAEILGSELGEAWADASVLRLILGAAEFEALCDFIEARSAGW